MTHLVELTEAECLLLLHQEQVARVALCTPLGPRILPVNYSMHDDSVFFRTMPYSVLGTYGREADLAMEVDRLDYEHHQGWSVVVLGPAAMVEEPEELRDIRSGWNPEPWTGGHRYFYIRLRVRDVTGRRLVADARPSA
jgi:nitroimidazol reductase NimA-like FMN-containing flavoprotein (pyridoxamine 5'-phosphate oxidase superfamily)